MFEMHSKFVRSFFRYFCVWATMISSTAHKTSCFSTEMKMRTKTDAKYSIWTRKIRFFLMFGRKRSMFAREVKRERKIASTDALPTAPRMVLAIFRIIQDKSSWSSKNWDLIATFYGHSSPTQHSQSINQTHYNLAASKDIFAWLGEIVASNKLVVRNTIIFATWTGCFFFACLLQRYFGNGSYDFFHPDLTVNFSVHLVAVARGRSQHWQFLWENQFSTFFRSGRVIVSPVYASLAVQLANYLSPICVSHKMRYWSLVCFIDCIVNRDAFDLPSIDIESRRSNRIINESID